MVLLIVCFFMIFNTLIQISLLYFAIFTNKLVNSQINQTNNLINWMLKEYTKG